MIPIRREVTLAWTDPKKRRMDKFLEVVGDLSEDRTVKVALSGRIENLEAIDFAQLEPYVSAYQILAFDYHEPQEGSLTNFHTILSDWDGPCITRTIAYLQEKGIDRKKIQLGLTTTGKIWLGVSPGPDENGYQEPALGKQRANPNIEKEEIESYLQQYPAAKVFHTSQRGVLQSFIYNKETGDWISFDNDLTIKGKTEWAQEQGLEVCLKNF